MTFIKFVFVVMDAEEVGIKMRRTDHCSGTFFVAKYNRKKHESELEAIRKHMYIAWGVSQDEMKDYTMAYKWQGVHVVVVGKDAMNKFPYLCFDRKLSCLNICPPRLTDDMSLFVNDFLNKIT